MTSFSEALSRMRPWKHPHVLESSQFSREEIGRLLEFISWFKETPDLGNAQKELQGRHLITFFLEPSTRTKLSFQMAARRLGLFVYDFSAQTTSLRKGESLRDTLQTLEALGADALVARHAFSGFCHTLADRTSLAVINAGDGIHEHPTQALLDLFTLWEVRDRTLPRRILIVGDVRFSRVARSNISLLKILGVKVDVVAPPTLLPSDLTSPEGISTYASLNEVVFSEYDGVMVLRLQKERQSQAYLTSLHEYVRHYRVEEFQRRIGEKKVFLMHPGPVNRDLDIKYEDCEGDYSLITRQVENGIYTRMAILTLTLLADR